MNKAGIFKLAIIGGRRFIFKDVAFTLLDRMLKEKIQNNDIYILGGTRENNKIARKYAEKHNFHYDQIKADWYNISNNIQNCKIGINNGKYYNKSAGFNRDVSMILNSDGLVIFWNGYDRNINNIIQSILKAKYKIPLRVFDNKCNLMYRADYMSDLDKIQRTTCCTLYFINIIVVTTTEKRFVEVI